MPLSPSPTHSNYNSIKDHLLKADNLAWAGDYMLAAEEALKAVKVCMFFEAEASLKRLSERGEKETKR